MKVLLVLGVLGATAVSVSVSLTCVAVHVERLGPGLPLAHVGVTFTDSSHFVRFDCAPFPRDGKCMTTFTHRERACRDPIDIYDDWTVWGYSNFSLNSLSRLADCLSNRRYVLGVNDCRHYVHGLTSYACAQATPVLRWPTVRNTRKTLKSQALQTKRLQKKCDMKEHESPEL